MKTNSYILKLFTMLAVLISLLSIVISISTYNYSQEVVGNEISKLNNVVLKQVSNNVSGVIVDSIALCNKVAYDSKLIEFLKEAPANNETYAQEEKIIFEYIGNIITNYIWLQSSNKNLFNAYIIGYNGTRYTTYAHKFDFDEIYSNIKYKDVFKANGDAVVIGTFQDPVEKGIYRYAFQVAKEIRDHITGEPYGIVILNISENVLYNSYGSLVGKDRDVMIVDKKGYVLSNKDKRHINEKVIDFTEHIDEPLGEKGNFTIKNDNESYMVFYNRINGTEWYLVEKVALDTVRQPLENIKSFIFAATAIFMVFIFILLESFAKKAYSPVMDIKNKMEQVTQGDLKVRALYDRGDEFGQIGRSFNEMVGQIENLLMTIKEEESKKRLAELDFLQAQINPHFIYNTLSSIRFYVEMNKNKEAEEMLFLFSKILRKTLSRSDVFITIRDELKTIENYVQLQKLRYTDKFEVTYDIPENILDFKIPTFILQPIVENSIFYNVDQLDIILIRISSRVEDEKIKIIIEDNGVGMSKEQIHNVFNKEVQVNKVGLINVHERIQLNYGMDYGLKINSNDGRGTQVILELPTQE